MNLVNSADIVRDIRPTEQPALASVIEINLQRASPPPLDAWNRPTPADHAVAAKRAAYRVTNRCDIADIQIRFVGGGLPTMRDPYRITHWSQAGQFGLGATRTVVSPEWEMVAVRGFGMANSASQIGCPWPQ